MAEPKELRIVYMGTPDFAVEPLRLLVHEGYNVVATVTVPDKFAGRGQKLNQLAVKQFALETGLKVLQPEKLRDPNFVDELVSLNADLFIVVAFRMLPEIIWRIPKLGTFNLHASLLPNYRGAAPINWAVINGEKETGVTTFLIDKEIDTGKILLQRSIPVEPNETAGELHDRLMMVGSTVVIDTVNALALGNVDPIPQDKYISQGTPIKPAPKLFKESTRISWEETAQSINNFIRGLSPYPAAWSELIGPDSERVSAKVFRSEAIDSRVNAGVGTISTDGKSYLHVTCGDGGVSITEIQLAGKRRLAISEFLLGFRDIKNFRFE
ncbi:MAG: methionyl-tRNA formyltransferase [Tenuifilaceae bacterium]|jgi:methionyl-tRNA formyltransferase|nr:methionyl-tRNA formyltransferase [Tenuifilaceae bacterium]